MSRTIHALFDSHSEATAAEARLVQAGIAEERIDISRHSATAGESGSGEGRGLWAKIKEAFMPGEDRATYEEGMRRGGCLLTAYVDDGEAERVIQITEQSNPVDLDTREQEWRAAGWNPQASMSPRVGMGAQSMGADMGEAEERIPVVEERLHVGKREVRSGGKRVRSYIVEQPVHEEIELRDEHVEVERRPVGERLSGSPDQLLQEREIEITETREEPMIAKEAVVTEELVVRKRGGKRVEKIDDTVRRTEVDVDDLSEADRAAQTRRPSGPGTRPPSPRH